MPISEIEVTIVGLKEMIRRCDHSIESLADQRAQYQTVLDAIQADGLRSQAAIKRRGRPPKTITAVVEAAEAAVVPRSPTGAKRARSGWPEDPAERRIEMLRRREVARKNKLAKKRWTNREARQQAAVLKQTVNGVEQHA